MLLFFICLFLLVLFEMTTRFFVVVLSFNGVDNEVICYRSFSSRGEEILRGKITKVFCFSLSAVPDEF